MKLLGDVLIARHRGHTLYVGSENGKLLAIDVKAQKLAWEFCDGRRETERRDVHQADGTPNYEAAFSDFFHDDMIIGMNRIMSAGAVLSSPAIVGNVIYFGSNACTR